MVDRYTDRQIQFLSILPSITAPFSVIGSSIVLYMIWNSKTTTTTQRRLYHRLVTAICISDIIISCTHMLGPLPVRNDIGVSMAYGNVVTCTLSGVMMHFGFSNAFYNMSLMVTFLLMVRYEVREDDIAQRYERYMHILAIGYPLITGIIGLVLEVFNPVNSLALLRCYIAAYPPDCDLRDSDVECTRGSMARPFLAIAALLPILITVGVLFTSTFLVWWTVRQNDRRTRRTSQYNVQNTSREVGIQSMIYGIFFFNTYVYLVIDPIVDVLLGGGNSPLRIVIRIISDLFYPTQGIWTLFIYIRPRYVRIRRVTYVDKSRFWALKESIFGEKLDYYNSRNMISSSIRQQQQSTSFFGMSSSNAGRSIRNIFQGRSGDGSGVATMVSVAAEKTSEVVVSQTLSPTSSSQLLVGRTSSSNLDPSYSTPEGPILPSQQQQQQQQEQSQEDQDDRRLPISSTLNMAGVVETRDERNNA